MLKANTNRKKVIVYNNVKVVEEFNSVGEANKALHIDTRYTIKVNNGIIKSGKYKGLNIKTL